MIGLGHNPVDAEGRRGGITLPAATDRSYELRSRGPATLSSQALDNLVSRSRASSTRRSPSPPPAAAPPSPPAAAPPSPATSSAASCSAEMGDSEDLKTTVASLAAIVKSLQSTAEANSKAIAELVVHQRSSSSSSKQPMGETPPDRPPRFQKLDFPRFDGKSDPMLFLNKCDSYFRQQRTMAEERVWMASYHLEDVAQLWYDQLLEDENIWARFKELLNLRFGPPLRAAPLFELAECRRTGTVEDPPATRGALGGGAARPALHGRPFVRIHNPETLAAAMSLARGGAWSSIGCSRLRLELALPALPAPPSALPAAQARGVANQAKRLSPEEQAERRRLGLCYNCNEPYARGHNRVCRRLFYIDGIELLRTKTRRCSPSARSPVCPFVTRCSDGFTALLDTGSTHNFIAETAARRTGLQAHTGPRLTATVANGERISRPACRAIPPSTSPAKSSASTSTSCPSPATISVLGTRTMSFTRRGRAVCRADVTARGPPLPAATTSPRALLDEPLAGFGGIFAEPAASPPQRAHDHAITLKP
ncbi:LOW QUALITY PROTEIN: hypothetical protein U9M48_042546 [Paspalum notatum var. saurae]|uniref:Retrotransposon gag domain-containing protein n=1 Tax=Paspalum notatum var. saurae TaxID=547442 RepID=A0AAQ3XG96_PASNO